MLIKFRYSLVHTEPHNLSLSRALIGFIISSSGHTLFLPVPTLGVQRFPSLSQWACFHQTLGSFYSLSLSTWVLPLPSFQSSTIRPFWSLPSGNLLQSCPTFTIFFHFCLISVCKHVQTFYNPTLHTRRVSSILLAFQVITHFPSSLSSTSSTKGYSSASPLLFYTGSCPEADFSIQTTQMPISSAPLLSSQSWQC